MESPPDRTFIVVRPYPAAIRRRVFTFLEEMGFALGDEIPVGTPDDQAASTLEDGRSFDLVLMPYHKHKADDDSWVNGFGVLSRLGDKLLAQRVPILMPVDEFTYASSFAREIEALRQDHPRAAGRLITMREREIGSAAVRDEILSLAGSTPAS